jgi:hypothetical protein
MPLKMPSTRRVRLPLLFPERICQDGHPIPHQRGEIQIWCVRYLQGAHISTWLQTSSNLVCLSF